MLNTSPQEHQYISLAEATKYCPYSQEYLSLRAKQGKLKAVKIGRNWTTTKEWVDEYLKKYNKEYLARFLSQEINSQAIPQEPEKQELKEFESLKQEVEFLKQELQSLKQESSHPKEKFRSSILKSLKVKKFLRPRIAFAALFIFLILGAGLLFVRTDIPFSLREIFQTRVGAQLNNSFSLMSGTAEALQDNWIPVFTGMTEKIPPLIKGGVGGFFSKELSSLKPGFHSMGNFISQTLQQAQGIISKPFASVFDWLLKPITKEAPPSVLIVREIIQQQEAVRQEAVRPPEAVGLPSQGLPSQPPPQIIQPKQIIEITKETRVTETIKETIREITRAADLIPIENMLNSLSSRLSSVIDTSGYVSSPRQYQQDGDLYLTTAGSGNVYVSASQGTYLSGQQLILDATASGNQGQAIIQLRDATIIQGTLSAQNGIDITTDNLTVGGTNFIVYPASGNITSQGLLSLTTTTGTSTVSHNLRVQGQLTIGANTTYITADYIQTPYFTSGSTSTQITGDFSVSSNATTTGNQIIQGTLTVNATSTLATTSLAYLTATSNATSTFAGPIAASTGNLLLSRAGTGDILLNPYGGNVGIGSSTPSQLLSIQGNTFLTGGLGIGTATTTAGVIQTTGLISGGSSLYISGSGIFTSYLTVSGTSATSTFAGGLTIDTDTLVIDYQTNRVGIGTSSPYAKLSVVGQTVSDFFTATSTTATSSFPYLSITNNSSLGTIIGGTWQGSTITANYGGTGITSATAGYTLIGNSSTALQATSTLFVSSAGSVGIGTTTPTGLLFVGTTTPAFVITSAGQVGIGTTSPLYKLTIQGGTGENLLQIATSTAPNILIIASSGNVGIGTAGPVGKLHVSGGRLILDADQAISLSGAADNNWGMRYNSSCNVGSATVCFDFNAGVNNGAFRFINDPSGTPQYRMVIDNTNGYVGIATTTPSSLLTVGATSGSQILINSSGQITGGTWQGTAIGATYGGTGQTTYAIYDLLYASAANTLSKVSSYNVNPTNLLPSGSGGMELWPDGTSATPFGWGSGGASTKSRESTIVKHGTYSFKETGATEPDAITTTIPWSNYYQGRQITCGTWVNTATANHIRVRITDSVGSTFSSYHTGGGAWEFLSATRTIDAAATSLSPAITWVTTATAYIDGYSCVEGPTPTAFAEAPMTGARRLEFRARMSVAQEVGAAAYEKLNFDTELFDYANKYDSNSTNCAGAPCYRYTPGEDGTYFCRSHIHITSPADQEAWTFNMYKNGSEYSADRKSASGAVNFTLQVADIVFLDEDDYIEMFIFSSATKNTGGAAVDNGFGCYKID